MKTGFKFFHIPPIIYTSENHERKHSYMEEGGEKSFYVHKFSPQHIAQRAGRPNSKIQGG
jgi:hypothetical protein